MLNYQTPPPRLDPVFHALSDGARRSMLARLCEGPATVGELALPLPMSLPAVLQHLKVLEAGGLVSSRKEGRTRVCTLEPAALAAAGDWIGQRRAFWEGALHRLRAHLDEDARPAGPSAEEI
ncbi:MAG: helix-turn-helix transcriptional regulator [Proteobacteria bacterium]|nr:helix-turn-helix transcriptional regulator [Pseudomonadota bacterium]MBS0574210.1 helix-turn-helix transcriptional regulator [Pseudomonadota bacterium]